MTLKFETYLKDPRRTLAEHLRAMFVMFRDRKAGNDLSDGQQILAVILSLPKS